MFIVKAGTSVIHGMTRLIICHFTHSQVSEFTILLTLKVTEHMTEIIPYVYLLKTMKLMFSKDDSV